MTGAAQAALSILFFLCAWAAAHLIFFAMPRFRRYQDPSRPRDAERAAVMVLALAFAGAMLYVLSARLPWLSTLF